MKRQLLIKAMECTFIAKATKQLTKIAYGLRTVLRGVVAPCWCC